MRSLEAPAPAAGAAIPPERQLRQIAPSRSTPGVLQAAAPPVCRRSRISPGSMTTTALNPSPVTRCRSARLMPCPAARWRRRRVRGPQTQRGPPQRPVRGATLRLRRCRRRASSARRSGLRRLRPPPRPLQPRPAPARARPPWAGARVGDPPTARRGSRRGRGSCARRVERGAHVVALGLGAELAGRERFDACLAQDVVPTSRATARWCAWVMSPRIVGDWRRERADHHPQLHRLEVLRLVDDDVHESTHLGIGRVMDQVIEQAVTERLSATVAPESRSRSSLPKPADTSPTAAAVAGAPLRLRVQRPARRVLDGRVS
jgi:hypothetical protein